MSNNIRHMLVAIAAMAALLVGLGAFQAWVVVDFADPALEGLVRDLVDRPAGTLFVFDVRDIAELDATGRGISDLGGIHRLRALTVLNLEDNHISDVSPLRGLPALEDLSLRNNGITDLGSINLSALEDLPLRRLSLRHNVVRPEGEPQVRLSDINPLAGFTDLIELELRDNHISDIRPLAELSNLRILDISQNPLLAGDIAALGGLTTLVELNLRETGVRDLSPLSGMASLTYLNIHSNPEVRSLAPIGDLAGLEVLIMRNVPVGDEIAYLSDLVHLHRLNVRNTGITDLSVLGCLMQRGALQDDATRGVEADIDIRDNPIPELSVSGTDGYAPLRPYWHNVTNRQPESLP